MRSWMCSREWWRTQNVIDIDVLAPQANASIRLFLPLGSLSLLPHKRSWRVGAGRDLENVDGDDAGGFEGNAGRDVYGESSQHM